MLLTVTCVLDARDPLALNTRYLMNQLVVDNGFPDKQMVAMVTQRETLTVTATPTSFKTAVASASASASVASAGNPVLFPTATPDAAGTQQHNTDNLNLGSLEGLVDGSNQQQIIPFDPSIPFPLTGGLLSPSSCPTTAPRPSPSRRSAAPWAAP